MPPVTALRSPPDSRITGALSPVITDSSTVAMPSITSPSPGIRSPASQSTTSPARSAEAATGSILPPDVNTLGGRVGLGLAQASACALPRASAMASAKLANSTVNQSQSAIWNENPRPAPPVNRSRMRNTVVSAAPTSTTNITGFFSSVTGIQLHEGGAHRAADDLADRTAGATAPASWEEARSDRLAACGCFELGGSVTVGIVLISEPPAG